MINTQKGRSVNFKTKPVLNKASTIRNAIMLGAGYLGSEIVAKIPRNWHIAKSIDDINRLNGIYGISEVWNFACPTDDFEANFDRLIDTVELARNCAKFCAENDVKLIYASSWGSQYIHFTSGFEKLYGALKLVNEFITQQCPNSMILRIPRVYSYDKSKGLIKELKEGTYKGELLEIRDFMTLGDFVDEVSKLDIANDCGVVTLEPTKSCSLSKLLEYLETQ